MDGLAGCPGAAVPACGLLEWRNSIVVAVPTAPTETCDALRQEVDDVVCAQTPDPFMAVGLWYRDFAPVSDAEVADAIARADYTEPEGHERAAAPPPGPPLQREGGLFRRFRDGFRYDSES